MVFPGKKIRIPKWIHGNLCIVHVEVDAIVPDDDPSEPCLEPATARWLDRLQCLANEGNIDELAKVGEVYVRRSA